MTIEVCAADLCAVLREQLEAIVPPHRRARSWEKRWSAVEEFANDADDDNPMHEEPREAGWYA